MCDSQAISLDYLQLHPAKVKGDDRHESQPSSPNMLCKELEDLRGFFKGLAALAFTGCLAIFFAMGAISLKVPDTFYVREGQSFSLDGILEGASFVESQPVSQTTTGVYKTELRLFGVIPIKSIDVSEVGEQDVLVCGTPFGIKMLTDGVLVVGLSEIETQAGLVNPGNLAGIKKGDVLLTLGGSKVLSNRDVASRVADSDGGALKAVLRRGNVSFETTIQPVQSAADGRHKIGLWVRDSSAGIGTMTFYDPTSTVFGGLGHAITDVDTGEIMPLLSGEIVSVDIEGAIKGVGGTPGELRGSFHTDTIIGSLQQNRETGVFGVLDTPPSQGVVMPVALRQEIQTGKAYIYTTTEGNTPHMYEIEIERVNLTDANPTRNMVIRVTDPTLLATTGGIVQGMSGSPIVQNGQLIGAVTHVFVNDPTRGYGIFAENMIKTIQSLEKVQLDNVS